MVSTYNNHCRILIVEDDEFQISFFQAILKNCDIYVAYDGTSALKILKERAVDLIILDHHLDNNEKGLDFLPEIKKLAAHAPVIMCSAFMGTEDQLKSLQGPLSAHYFMPKPVNLKKLLFIIDTAIRECGLAEAVAILKSISGNSSDNESSYAKRFERLVRIKNIMTTEPIPPPVSELARQLKTSRRTILRDLKLLNYKLAD